MGKEEAGETAREGGGMASSVPLFQSLFRTGAALTALFLCFSNGGSECCPHVFSFPFEWGPRLLPCGFSFLFTLGQHLLPPCLFFSFRMGAASAAPVSFLFFSNGGSTCCPCVFSFHFEQTGGAVCGIHTAPISLSFDQGQRVSPCCPIPFHFEWGQCVLHTPPPVSFGFNRGQRETHMPPPFRVLYPPIMGGI